MYSFIGKGGVGKTTSAATVALKLSKKGRVLVVSLDPAHNLGDVLGTELGEEPKEVAPNLFAAEPDVDEIIRRHVKSVVEEMKNHYKYLKVIGLDKMLDVLELTPGVEEDALLNAFASLMEGDYDYLVVDHAPTGIAVRILLLPEVMLGWVSKLRKLREEIVRRRKVLAKMEGKGAEEDPVLELLRREEERLKGLRDFMKGRDHKVVLVMNPEEMPTLEALRVKRTLERFGIKPCAAIVNKVIEGEPEDPLLRSLKEIQQKYLEMISKEFAGAEVYTLPYLPKPPKGLKDLEGLAERLGEGPCSN